MDGFECAFKGLDLAFCHIRSAKMAVTQGLELYEHSGEGFFISGVRFLELDFFPPVLRLLVETSYYDY